MRLATQTAFFRTHQSRSAEIISIALFGLSIALLTIHALSVPANHDEHQYLSAGYLWPDKHIYSEFFYSQTPYFPVALSLWMELLDQLPRLLAGRLFNLMWSLVFAVTLWIMMRRLSRDPVIASLILLAVVASPILDLASQAVRNDMMPLALSALACLCLLTSLHSTSRRFAIGAFLAGSLVALAVGAKLSYAFVPVAMGLSLLFTPGLAHAKDRLPSLLIPFVLGGVLAGLPILYIASADWSNFVFATTEFHRTASSEFYAQQGLSERLGLNTRAWTIVKILVGGPTFVLLLILSWLIPLVFFIERSFFTGADREVRATLFLSIIGLMIGMPFMLLAKPLHPQYLAPLLLFLGLGCAAWAGLLKTAKVLDLEGPGRKKLRSAIVLLIILGVALPAVFNPFGRGAVYAIAQLHKSEFMWITEHADRVRDQLRKALGENSGELRIATLMSIYPIDAGFGIYEELAGSPFFFRNNDIYPRELLRKRRGITPDEVYEWLGNIDATAILVGYAEELERGFVRYAQDHDFVPFGIDLRGGDEHHNKTGRGTLWIAPRLNRITSLSTR